MVDERIDTVVVGGGQAGIAMSEHLGAAGVPHVVLERHRIAERWRSERWDSLVANGPAWHDRFPGLAYPETGPDGFPGKDEVAEYFEAYARKINAPVRCGVTVHEVTNDLRCGGYLVSTSHGVISARCVVAATGPFQKPLVPEIIPDKAPVMQLHSSRYHNPDALPAGAVLVVGAGSSGVQIAQELMQAGRKVFLSIGAHDRPPRRYRGRDFVWWLGVLGKWGAERAAEGSEHVTIAVSGAYGGQTVDFRDLAAAGITLLGQTDSYADGVVRVRDTLAADIAQGDASYLAVLKEADAYATANGLDLPEEPEAWRIGPTPTCVSNPVRDVDLPAEGITTVIWATGFTQDFGWLRPAPMDVEGRPLHSRGASPTSGIYFIGLPWLINRGSSFIWGVWHDAKHIADQVVRERRYALYVPERPDHDTAVTAVEA